MPRAFIAHLLMLVVLFCPYFCMGAEAESATTHRASSRCASCDEPTSGDNEAPQQREEDSDCLCQGALLDNAKVEASETGIEFFVAALVDVNAEVVAAYVSADLSRHVCHFPPFSTGRDVCALTCALLL